MEQLTERVAQLTDLIQRGQTLEAMEQYYADDVLMQENETPPRVGKAVCLEHERRMLTNTTSLQATLLNQAIDEVNGVVFSEWKFEFTDLLKQRFRLTEVSVQQWHNGIIYKETFFYNKVLPIR